MSQSDVATGKGDVVRSRNRTTWRPAPLAVRAAGYLLFVDATVTIAAAVAVAGPTVFSRFTGLEMLPGASARAPMVWEVALPSVIGAALGIAFAALEVWCGLLLWRVRWWGRLLLSSLVVVAAMLALVPGAIAIAFHVSGWAGTLPGVKHVLLLAAFLLVWLPAASRESLRRPHRAEQTAGYPPSASAHAETASADRAPSDSTPTGSAQPEDPAPSEASASDLDQPVPFTRQAPGPSAADTAPGNSTPSYS